MREIPVFSSGLPSSRGCFAGWLGGVQRIYRSDCSKAGRGAAGQCKSMADLFLSEGFRSMGVEATGGVGVQPERVDSRGHPAQRADPCNCCLDGDREGESVCADPAERLWDMWCVEIACDERVVGLHREVPGLIHVSGVGATLVSASERTTSSSARGVLLAVGTSLLRSCLLLGGPAGTAASADPWSASAPSGPGSPWCG